MLQKLFHNVPVVLPTVFCSHFCFCDIRQAVPWYIWPTQMLPICSHKKLTAEEPEDGLVSHSSCIHTDSEVRSCHSLAQYWHSFLILYSEKITVKTAATVLYINLWFDNLMAIWALSHEIASKPENSRSSVNFSWTPSLFTHSFKDKGSGNSK